MKNVTGLPNTGDYVLGRGTVYGAKLNPSTEKPDDDGWRDLGNCPEFTLSLESESLEHQSSRQGLKVVDKEVLLSQKMQISFALDEVNDDNLAEWLSGETAAHTNVAIAGFTVFTMLNNVKLGRWYDIVNASGERAYDVDAGNLLLEEVVSGDDLVLGTDYTLDSKMGRVFLLTTAVNVAAGEDVRATLTAAAGAKPVEEVRGMTQGNIIRAIKFIAENPANNNKQREYQFHKVTLRSEGEFGLISDEFAQMTFNGTVERSTLADADAPFVRIRDHADS